MEKEIHHKIAGIIIRNKKLLMCRKYDEPHFIMPGGRVLENETPEQTLRRELKEELGVELKSMKFFKTWEAEHFQDKNKIVKMETYFVETSKLKNFDSVQKSERTGKISDIDGEPKATSEINEIAWIDSNYKSEGIKVASINEDYLIPELKKLNLIN